MSSSRVSASEVSVTGVGSRTMPERTNSGLRGLPRVKTRGDQGSENAPLLHNEHREKKSALSKYVVPAIGGAFE